MNSLLIYTETTSQRLTYIFDFILGDLLGLQYELTSDKVKFVSYAGPRFSYASQVVADELFFEAKTLLFETDMALQPIAFVVHGDITGFYPCSKNSQCPFDMFASAFLMLTGYNEYLIHKKDKYERYRASQSMNYKADFLEKPMINYYALALKKDLSEKYPELVFRQSRFEYLPTFDIETAHAYWGKSVSATFAGFLRSFFLSDFRELRDRFEVVFRGKRDPFDVFDYILDTCKKYSLKSIFFFQVGDRSNLDRNTAHTDEEFRKTIKEVSDASECGIHLSYASHISNEVMKEEIVRLEAITGKKIFRNRFHYLRFTMPGSFLRLAKIGIREDYSCGFASRAGFRAGTCSPFFFFNLLRNEKTELKIFPFAFMDTTYTHYRKTKADSAQEKILLMMQYVKEVEGPFVAVWHNSTLAENRKGKGWRKTFETLAHEASELMQQL